MSREVPPAPPYPPIAGPAARLLAGTSLDAMAAQLRERGPTLRVAIAGADWVVSADPDVIRRVLVGNADNYAKDTRLMAPFLGLLGDGLLTSEGPLWRRQRAVLARAFRQGALRVVVGAAVRAALRACDELDEHARRGDRVDLGALLRRLSLRVIADATLSMPPDEADAAIAGLYDPIVAEANRRVWLPLRADLPLPSGARHDASLAALERLLDARIAARRAEPRADPPRDMLDHLLAAADPWTDAAAALVRDELKTMLFAGHETTSAALVWTMHAVMRQPACLARLRADADAVFRADAVPDLDALRGLDLAGACLKEALRLYNVVPVATRRALAADRLADADIPAGGLVLLHLQALHRDPRHWPEPDEFRPERFLDAPPGPTWHWLPFLAGPRGCIGQQFALLEARVALSLLVRRHDFSPDPANRDDRHRFNIPVTPAAPIAAHVTRRR